MTRKYRKMRSFGLKKKASILFLLLIIIPTLGVGVVVQYQYTDILREQFVDSTLRNLDSLTNQLEEQTSLVEDLANYMILSPDLNEYFRPSPPVREERAENLRTTVEGLLTFHLMSKKYIRSISITGYNGNFIEMGEPMSADETKWLDEAAGRKGGIVWSEAYTAQSSWNGQIRVVSLFRILNSFSEVTLPHAQLVIRLDEGSIVRQLKNGLYKDSGAVYVLGSDGEDILQTDDAAVMGSADPKAVLAEMKAEQTRYRMAELDGSRYLTFHRVMETTDWDVVVMIPESIVQKETFTLRVIMTVVLIVVLLLGLVALLGFHYTIIRPILRLKQETNRVKLGDFSASVPIESSDEISELNRKFNDMVHTIRDLIDQKYKLELRERESELKLLQNQMDPHFLYNTLDMIRWTARLEKAGKTSHLIEVLSRFFRSGLNKGRYVTTLQEELEFVQSYLYLQENRLGNRFRYSLYTEADITEAEVLKTTIQPMVENFVKHGLRKRGQVNTIAVRCYAVEGGIHIDVLDNGRGIEGEALEAIRASIYNNSALHTREIGALRNIHERISLYFGEEYGLDITSDHDGTQVRIKIPNSKVRQEEEQS